MNEKYHRFVWIVGFKADDPAVAAYSRAEGRANPSFWGFSRASGRAYAAVKFPPDSVSVHAHGLRGEGIR